jgi:predicted enzyme related to lactoylglutathione lyase
MNPDRHVIRPPIGTPSLVELPVSDLEKAARFYSALFPGWQLTEFSAGSLMTETCGETLAVLEQHNDPQRLRVPLVYFSVADLEAVLAHVTASGGTIKSPIRPVPLPDNEKTMRTIGHHVTGRYAKVRDPDGTVIGLWDING